MPKSSRKMDPLVGETSITDRHTSSSNSSSPLVPQLSIQMSPQHTEESNEVAQINSPSSHVFPLSSPAEQHQPGVIGPTLLSPDPLMSHNSASNIVKMSAFSSPRKRKASPDGETAVGSLLCTTGKGNSLLLGKDSLDTSDEGFSGVQLGGSDTSLEKEPHEIKPENEGKSQTGSGNKISETGTKDEEMIVDSAVRGDGKKESPEIRTELLPQVDGIQTDRGAACAALAGYVTLTARNGDSMMHGVLPSVIPHHSAALNSCFPGSDGNWYQIISASVPPVLSSPHLTENISNDCLQNLATVSADNLLNAASTGNNSLNFLPSLSLAATAATTTTNSTIDTSVSAPGTVGDPLLSFLQQYTASTVCSPEVQTALPALRLPLNLAAAATTGGAPHTPRYIYATNPRTGQLLILSSVGELGGAQTLQQQQLQLQQQQVMQMQQQPIKSMEKMVWKSPLGISQRQNAVPSAANGTLGRQAGRPGSLVNQLLQAKLPSGMGINQSSGHDENMPPVAAARELLALASPARTRPVGQNTIPPPLFHISPDPPGDEPIRENHNMKERRRRARIKDACDLMRQLVPGMSEKTDKATVFEFSARYIHFLKNFVGTHHDKDFLIKYSPY